MIDFDITNIDSKDFSISWINRVTFFNLNHNNLNNNIFSIIVINNIKKKKAKTKANFLNKSYENSWTKFAANHCLSLILKVSHIFSIKSAYMPNRKLAILAYSIQLLIII